MTARLTPAEARALGLTEKKPPKKTGKTVRAKDCLPNRCVTCDETFTGETAERRHAEQTGHLRYEADLRPGPDHRDRAGSPKVR